MRLINTSTHKLHEFFGDDIPPYAILSHRWIGNDEVTFQDLEGGTGPQKGQWGKVIGCCARAARDRWEYAWIDSCCINKNSSAELAEAINSMFDWYRAAQVCYVYLSDVPTEAENPYDSESHFRKSKWFTRGWTLQELLAPQRVEFYVADWIYLGTKLVFADLITSITGITHLLDYNEASVAQKMSWASKRETTRLEDQAYCLLGLFSVTMSLIYGEGPRAFIRLQEAILSRTEDESIFAWEGHGAGGLLASSPRLFQETGDIREEKFDSRKPPHTMTSKGLALELALLSRDTFEPLFGKNVKTKALAPINCKRIVLSASGEEQSHQICVALYRETENSIWKREKRLVLVLAQEGNIQGSERTITYVPQPIVVYEETRFDQGGDTLNDPRPSARIRGPVIKTIDWRRQICQFFELESESPDDTILEVLEEASDRLKEVERQAEIDLEQNDQATGDQPSQDQTPKYQMIYRMSCAKDEQVHLSLEKPFFLAGNIHLQFSDEIRNIDSFLEKNRALLFIGYKTYHCCGSISREIFQNHVSLEENDTSLMLESESILPLSPVLCGFLTELGSELAFEDKVYLPRHETNAPYLWWFHGREKLTQHKPVLTEDQLEHCSLFEHYLETNFGSAWADVDALLAAGHITAQYIDYLYTPNTIVVTGPDTHSMGHRQAYVTDSWLDLKRKDWIPSSGLPRPTNTEGSLAVISWKFNGSFQKYRDRINIGDLPPTTDAFRITSLKCYPLQYAENGLADELRARGMTFWTCRLRNFVFYKKKPGLSNQSDTGSRYMVDISTYNKMHPSIDGSNSLGNVLSEIRPESMARDDDEPPLGDNFLLCLPTTIQGFNFEEKLWESLDVSRIIPIRWNRQALDSLVLEDRVKELLIALVINRMRAEKIGLNRGKKGKGLLILLHGGPGTGKTTTAESVAEIAMRPLYRVSCGDIGTNPEGVEKVLRLQTFAYNLNRNADHSFIQYLEAVLYLAKVWDCVVFFDEADVFLESRTMGDIQRNAFISVFLRVLDYYDGIIFLSSSRVGSFDEAVLSRVQLTLRYTGLDQTQRLTIWKSFIRRLDQPAELYPEDGFGNGINYVNLMSHVEALARAQLNGREIRNVISTAMQLARYKNQELRYTHLAQVIEQAKVKV